MSKKYHVERREFLNKFSNMRAYIIAVVEDAREKRVRDDKDEYWSDITLKISDCSDEICLYFDLETVEDRENSLHKVRVLAEVINEFKQALELEAGVMNARAGLPRHERVSTAVH